MEAGNVIIGCVSRDSVSREYTQKVIDHLNSRYSAGIPAVEDAFSAGRFSGGEPDPQFRVPLEGKDVYLFGVSNEAAGISHRVSPEALVARLYFAAEAAYENNAASVDIVCPDLPFSRADKLYTEYPGTSEAYAKNKGRGRTARSVARMFGRAGVKNLLTLEAHSERVRSFYEETDIGFGNISPMPLIAHYLAHHTPLEVGEKGEGLVLVCPDEGATARVDELALHLRGAYGMTDTSVLYLEKMRKAPNNPDEVEITVKGTSENFTTMKGKYAIIVDDIVDTAGTFSMACRQIKNRGIELHDNGSDCPDGVGGVLVHPVLAGENFESPMKKLASSHVDELVFFNTHPFIEHNLIDSLKETSSIIRTAPLFAEGIHALEEGKEPARMLYADGALRPRLVDVVFDITRSSSFLRDS